MSNPIGPAPAIDLTSAKAGDPLPTGVGLRLVEIGGVLNATVDGVTYVPVGASTAPGTADIFYKTRASSFLGTSNLATLYRGFGEGMVGWTQNLVGASGVAQGVSVADSTDAVNSIGAITSFGTGTATNGASELFRGTADGSQGFAPFLASANVNIKFYYATRFQMSSAVDANAACGVGCRNWLVGVFGANSTTKYSVRIGTTGFNYVTSSIAIDTAFHILETWHDGSKAWICVDGETPIGIADTGFWPLTSTNNSFPIFTFAKVGGTTNYTGAVNWGLWCVKPVP